MKFVHGIIIAMGLLVAANLAFISADLESGNIPNYTKKAASLDMVAPVPMDSGKNVKSIIAVDAASLDSQKLVSDMQSETMTVDIAKTDEEVDLLADTARLAEEEAAAMAAEQEARMAEEAAAMAAEQEAAMKAEEEARMAEEEAARLAEEARMAEENTMTTENTSESAPMGAEVIMAIGSAVLGCDETNECYIPYSVTISKSETVTWINDDHAGHTVTAGDIHNDPNSVGVDYPNGFDSGLFMPGNSYSHTFEESGEYPYFCYVHPWMKGIVIVQ